MKTTCRLQNIAIDYKSNKPVLSFEVNNSISSIEEIKQADLLDIEVKRHRNKRKLNSNNYMWELVTQIGNILRKSKEEVYVQMLKDYGQSQMISVFKEIEVDKFLKYYEEAGESELNGRVFKHYKVYTGSSEFDTREMSIFVDGVVQEAKNLGIVTDTPEQIQKYKDGWK